VKARPAATGKNDALHRDRLSASGVRFSRFAQF
jgi:hypothetical protein